MPYIIPELRGRYNNIIELARQCDFGVARALLLEDLKQLHPTQVDGHLNYLFSKLLKDIVGDPRDYYKTFIKTILEDVYCSPPKYYKLQRLYGLLSCMQIEFNRRGWSDIAQAILGIIGYEMTFNILIPYENGKVRDNGDI